MEPPFDEHDAQTMLEKLAAFSRALSDPERAALNHIGTAAIQSLEGEEVAGFAAPGRAKTNGRKGAFPDVSKPPSGPGGVPIPYPNMSGLLSSTFPL